MKDALKILDNGNEVNVNVEGLTRFDKDQTYICPECRTPVQLEVGSNRIWFAHRKNLIKKLNREDCSRYVKKDSTNSNYDTISKVSGYPLLIINENNKFELYISIPRLTSKERQHLSKDIRHIKIKNSNGNFYSIPIEWVIDDGFICPINFSSYGNYEAVFVDENNIEIEANISSKILRHTVGLSKEPGMIFHANSYGGGRRILHGGQACVDNYYYYIRRYSAPNMPDGIEIVEEGELRLNNYSVERWRVYKIKALDCRIENRTFFLEFGINLIERALNINIVWPPLKEQEKTIYSKEDSKMYFVLNNNINKVELVIQEETTHNLLKQINKENKLHVVEVDNCNKKAHLIALGKSHPSYYELFPSERIKNSYYYKKIDLYNNKNELLIPGINNNIKAPITFKGNAGGNIIHIRNDIVLEINNRKIDKFDYSDIILLDSKAWGVYKYFNKPFFEDKIHINKKTKKIYDLLLKCYKKNISYYITVPYWGKKIMFNLIRSNKIHNRNIECLFMNWIKTNKIPVKVLTYLEQLNNLGDI